MNGVAPGPSRRQPGGRPGQSQGQSQRARQGAPAADAVPPQPPQPEEPLTPRARLVQLAVAVGDRLSNPSLQPPAWQLFLETVYVELPPQTLTHAQSAGEASALSQIAPMSTGVLRALRRALVYYHPDRNRVEDHGAEWAGVAEEVSKIATQLHEYYKRHISTNTSNVLEDVDD